MADQDTEPAEGAVAEAEAGPEEYRFSLSVDIADAGPCKKHVKVCVPEQDVQHFREQVVGELMKSAAVPGFRVGHVPKSLIERRFRSDVSTHVKQQVLLRSLDQINNEQKLDAINEPDLDFESLEVPEAGDFNYEFDVEVRPDFTLPVYTGLSIERPTKDITDADVDAMQTRYLEQFAQLAPSDDPAAAGDFVVVNIVARHGGRDVFRKDREQLRIRPILQFQDAVIADFDKLMIGAAAGTTKTVETTISMEADKIELRGEKVEVTFEVEDVLRLQLPELTEDFLSQIGLGSPEQLRDEIRETLNRQLELEQRQSARKQVLAQITESANWDLPESLVRRQVDNARRRDWLEMHQAGYSDDQIKSRESQMMQQRVTATRQALKEHFVLDKIATEEKLQVTPQDIEDRIRLMAFQRGENPRKVRARLEKAGMMENLVAQVLEELAVDLVLERAQFKDVPAMASDEHNIVAVDYSITGEAAPTSLPLAEMAELATKEKDKESVPRR